MLSLPQDICVADCFLRHLKPTRAIAMAVFDVLRKDSKNMVFWLRGEDVKSADVVLDGMQQAYDAEDMHMYEIMRNDELIGEIGFTRVVNKNKSVYIDYWLAPEVRGHALIDMFLPIMERLAFENLKMNKIVFGIDTANTASRRVAERNGYMLDGVLRGDIAWHDGTFHDNCEYSKLKSDWLKGNKNA